MDPLQGAGRTRDNVCPGHRRLQEGPGWTRCREPGGHGTTWAQGAEACAHPAVGWAPSSTSCEPGQASKGETFQAGAPEAQLGCPSHALSSWSNRGGSCSLRNESFQLGVLICHGTLLPTPPQPQPQNPEKIPFHGFPQSRCRAAGAGPGEGLGVGRQEALVAAVPAGGQPPCPQDPGSREGIAPRGPHPGEAKPRPNSAC